MTRPRTQLLALGSVVTVGQRTAAIVRRAGTDEHPIVALEGVEDRDAAGRLRGLELTVPRDAAPAPVPTTGPGGKPLSKLELARLQGAFKGNK